MDFAFVLSAALAYHYLAARRSVFSDSVPAADPKVASILSSVPGKEVFLGAPGGTSSLEAYKVPRLFEILGEVPETFPNPLLARAWPRNNNFVAHGDRVIESQMVLSDGGGVRSARQIEAANAAPRAFTLIGPFQNIVFNPATLKVAVVTCGGLCPGLNTVIRDIVMCLTYIYGAKEIWGIMNGEHSSSHRGMLRCAGEG